MKEHPDFEVKSWRMQRTGQVAMVVVVLSALAGVFGNGPLSEREVKQVEGAVRVPYPRFLRVNSEARIRVEALAAPNSGSLSVWLDQRYTERMNLARVTPGYRKVHQEDGRVVFGFSAAPTKAADFRPQRAGIVSGAAGAGSGPAVSWSHIIYP